MATLAPSGAQPGDEWFNPDTGVLAKWVAPTGAVPGWSRISKSGGTAPGMTTASTPVTGTYLAGDYVVDVTGQVWICVIPGVAGSTAAFRQAGAGRALALSSLTGG
ncbi:MAG: hypothetical protein EBQ56_15175 [Proteobacteria bacterium]|jgi:hypothetical protein|nr:hypothetical protein [Pseudomonadota bacterium]